MLTFTIGKIRISISFWFFAAIGFFLLRGRAALFWYFVLPIICHELGHLLALYLCGSGVAALRFRVFGVEIQPVRGELSYPREITVTLAGPALNLILAAALYLAAYPTTRSMLLCAANLAVGLFNLLPIGDLDGGTLARLLGERFGGVDFGQRLSKTASFLVLLPLFSLAFRLLLRPEPNATLLAVCCYLAGVVISR